MSSSPTTARRFEQVMDQLHARARSSLLLRYFATVNRILLAVGFVPTGLVKLRGERFAQIDIDTPVGAFFEAMYSTGLYWQFIGLGQVLGGVLLLIRATSTLGAVIFFPIILNIFIITLAMDFRGTPFITGGMLLANLFLLCWDWHRLKPILLADPVPVSVPAPVEGSTLATRLERAGYVAITVGGMAAFLWTRRLVPTAWVLPGVGLGLVGGLLLLISLVLHWRGRRPRTQLVPAA